MTQRTKNFLKLYFDAIDENIDEVKRGLKDSDIDPEESEQRIMQMIKQKNAEIKIERGKRLKAKVEKIIRKNSMDNNPAELDKHLALAARKLDKLSESDILTIKKNNALLDDINHLISKESNEA